MSNEPFSLFFGNLVGLLRDLETRRDDGLDGCTSDYCAYAVRQLQQYAIHVYQMIATVDGARSEESQRLKDLLEELLVNLRGIEGMWQHEVTLRSPGSQQRVEPARRVRTVQHGVGRPFVCQLATTHSPRLVLTHTIYC